MRKELVLRNIEHCDHYLRILKDPQHQKYYTDRKNELIRMLPDDEPQEQNKSPKFISAKSPKLIAEKYYDFIQSGQLKLREVCKYEKVNEGSLSKAIFRIREKKGYGINKKIKM
jgi:hypothetical protein